jgi:molybdopterin-synthase adenylyltransferase
MFTEEQLQRYSRQLILSQVGGAGQAKIKKARVLCVGAGGLGSPAALYLAAAGVGVLGLVDDDPVDLSNLHRQILHYTTDVGRPKVLSAKAKLESLNPETDVKVHRLRLEAANALDLIRGYDVVLDGSDNFPTRYLVNDACVLAGLALVSGAVLGLEGQVTTILPRQGHCYRCLFPEPPSPEAVQSCAEAGVLGPVAGVTGSLQAMEALKIILGLPGVLSGRLLSCNLSAMSFREIPVRRRADCALCGEAPSITALVDYEQFCGAAGPGR